MNEAAMIGSPIDAIPTPTLVVDLDRLEQNLRRMADYFASRPAKLRPHFKSHKSVELARRQLAAGSCTGITCAKLAEAEQLVAGSVSDVLIANQVVGPDKARRLAALNRSATVRSAVDSLTNARELSTRSRHGVAASDHSHPSPSSNCRRRISSSRAAFSFRQSLRLTIHPNTHKPTKKTR